MTLAIVFSVLTTLVVVALLWALWQLNRQARRLKRAAERLERQADAALARVESASQEAEQQLDRMDLLVGSAEHLSDAVGSASRIAGTAISAPVIKAMAFGTGAARASRRLRGGGGGDPHKQLPTRESDRGRSQPGGTRG